MILAGKRVWRAGISVTKREKWKECLSQQDLEVNCECGLVAVHQHLLALDTYQIHYVKNAMGARKQLTFFADHVSDVDVCDVLESPNKDTLLFTMDKGGNEQYQISFQRD
jgi:hypothetical protein